MTEFKIIPTGLVLVDDAYQRELDQRWVDRHVDTFDARLLGTLTVTPRNGHYTVIDGQHRLRLAQRVGIKEVPCIVVKTGDQADAAGVFVAVNRERRSVSPIDIYHADLLSGNVTALAVRDSLDRHGYKFSATKLTNRSTITSVMSVRRAVRLYGPDVLDFALETVTHAWGYDAHNARRSHMLMGLFAVHVAFPDVPAEDFAKRVGRKSPLFYIQEWSARKQSAGIGGSALDGVMGEILVSGYNAGLSARRLDELKLRMEMQTIGTRASRFPWEERETKRLAAEASA